MKSETYQAQLGQLEQDVAQLRSALVKLKQDKAALLTFLDRAHRRNFAVLCFVLIVSAIGWFAGGSTWLRWYVFPVALLLCGVFSIGAGVLKSYTGSKIAKLEDAAFNAEVAIAQFKTRYLANQDS